MKSKSTLAAATPSARAVRRRPSASVSLVLSLNPAVDAEWRVDRIRWDEKNVLTGESRWAGGKGINAARWLQHLRGNPRLLLPLGGPAGAELARELAEEGLAARMIPLTGDSRVNVMVTQDAGPQLRFNQPGPRFTRDEWRTTFAAATDELRGAGLFIISGSLPREGPVATYARMVRLAHAAGVRTLLDCDGPALPPGLRERPFLIKPNGFELELWCGRKLRTEAAVVRAAREMSEASGGWVLVSRAGAGGLLVNVREDFVAFAQPPVVPVRNTVGAGDSLLAAAAVQILADAPPVEWLRWGVATATAAVQVRAGTLPQLAEVRAMVGQIRVGE